MKNIESKATKAQTGSKTDVTSKDPLQRAGRHGSIAMRTKKRLEVQGTSKLSMAGFGVEVSQRTASRALKAAQAASKRLQAKQQKQTKLVAAIIDALEERPDLVTALIMKIENMRPKQVVTKGDTVSAPEPAERKKP